MKLRINGKAPGEMVKRPAVERALEFLRGMKDGELLSTRELAESLDMTIGAFTQRSLSDRRLGEHSYRWRNKRLWGNRKTVERAAKELR